jgi:hypothetical protein
MQEGTRIRLLSIGYRVVSKATLGVSLPELTCLSVTHTVIREVRQRDHSRATNTTDYDNLTDLAHDIMALKRVKLTTRSILKDGGNEPEELIKRLRTRGTTTKDLEPGTSRADLTHVPLRDLTGIQERDKLTKSLSPTFLTV